MRRSGQARRLIAALLAAPLLLGACASTSRGTTHRVEHAAEECPLCDVYRRAADFVVRIHTPTGLGAGIVADATGLIATNAHVVATGRGLIVETADGRELAARLVCANDALDIALIQVEEQPATTWHPADILASEAAVPARVGSEVYTIGHPIGLGWSVSRGIVTGHRMLGPAALIQTDAAISPGNSGGPLLDDHGHLIGIVTSKARGTDVENVAFARPVASLLGLLERYAAKR